LPSLNTNRYRKSGGKKRELARIKEEDAWNGGETEEEEDHTILIITQFPSRSFSILLFPIRNFNSKTHKLSPKNNSSSQK
jgi:hypothetical protein